MDEKTTVVVHTPSIYETIKMLFLTVILAFQGVICYQLWKLDRWMIVYALIAWGIIKLIIIISRRRNKDQA